MSKELPEDVIIHILLRVPTRYILRFKTVCKSWYSLFQNPNFISKHIQNLSTISDSSFLLTPTESVTLTSTSDRTVNLFLSDSSYKSIKIPIEIDLPFQVSGSCNGLICLSGKPWASVILLWNPATRVFKDLPISPIDRPRYNRVLQVVLGFGFDDVVKDYKVLRIAYCYNRLFQAEMYSLSTNSWRLITTRADIHICESTCCVFLNGKFHWIDFWIEGVFWNRGILCFDIHEEAFNYITPPKFEFTSSNKERMEVCWKVVALKGALSVIAWRSGSEMALFEVWLMKEYGVWLKYTSFQLQESRFATTLGCGLKGEFLLENNNGQLVVYDPDTQRVKKLGIHAVDELSMVFNHVGSLIPINGGKVATRTNLSSVVPDTFFVR